MPPTWCATSQSKKTASIEITSASDRRLIERTIQVYHRIDIVVLNAGVNAHCFFEEYQDLSVFKRIMDVNFYGYVYCTK